METHRLLAELYKKSGLSMRELSARSGVSTSAVERALNGPRLLPRGQSLDAILQQGFKLKPEHATYKKVVAAWTRERLSGYSDRNKLMTQIANLPDSKVAKLKKLIKDL